MKLLIIAEGSALTGYGHLVRCITIGEYLVKLGWSCTIVDPGSEMLNVPFLNIKDFKKISYKTLYQFIDNSISNEIFDLSIIDGYNIKRDFKFSLYKITKKIMIIDDLAKNNNYCDIILDQTPNRTPFDYKNLVPDDCQILTGTKYIFLRKEILNRKCLNNYRKKKLKKRKRKILLSLGSTDPENMTEKVLKFLLINNFKIEIQIISTKYSVNLPSIKKLLKIHKNKFKIFLNPTVKELKQIYLDTDLCIGSCGIAIWERIYYGIPNIIYKPNAVQKHIGGYLIEKKIIYELLDRYNVLSFSSIKMINNLIRNDFLSSRLVSKGQLVINKEALKNIFNIINKVVKNEI